MKAYQLKTIDSSNVIRGTRNMSRDKLRNFDPAYTGLKEVFVLSVPLIATKAGGELLQHVNNLKNIIEHSLLSYSGAPELSPDTSTIQTGSDSVQIPVFNKLTLDGAGFSFNCLETSQEPIRRAVEYMLYSLYDVDAEKAGEIFTLMDMDWVPANYCWEFAICSLDPTLRYINDIDVWKGAVISQAVDRDSMNFEAGNMEIIGPRTINFNGIPLPSSNDYAEKLLPLLNDRMSVYGSYLKDHVTNFNL